MTLLLLPIPRWVEQLITFLYPSKRRWAHVWDSQLHRETFYCDQQQQVLIQNTRRINHGMHESSPARNTTIITYFRDTLVGATVAESLSSTQDSLLTTSLDTLTKNPNIYVFCLHGMFLSGNSFIVDHHSRWEATDESKNLNSHPLLPTVTLVCLNRPGYFGSTTTTDLSTYTYHQFADEIHAMATQHLGISHYYVIGHSSGGPYALACAYFHPSHVLGVGLLAGDPEYGDPSIPNKRWTSAFLLGTFLPFLFRYVLCLLSIARNGWKGMVLDYRLETTPYEFNVEQIEVPVLYLEGSQDHVLPSGVSWHAHSRLPNCTTEIVPTGHMGLLSAEYFLPFLRKLIRGEKNKQSEAVLV